MAKKEIDQHQRHVEFEFFSIPHRFLYAIDGPEFKGLHLAIRGDWAKTLRQVEVVAIQSVPTQAFGPFHRVAD